MLKIRKEESKEGGREEGQEGRKKQGGMVAGEEGVSRTRMTASVAHTPGAEATAPAVERLPRSPLGSPLVCVPHASSEWCGTDPSVKSGHGGARAAGGSCARETPQLLAVPTATSVLS